MRFPPHPEGSRAAEAVKGSRRRPPRPPLTQPAQLTPNERKALQGSMAMRGKPVADVHPVIRTRLIDAGWVTRRDTLNQPSVLLITKTGRKALNAILPEEVDRAGVTINVWLKRGDGLTTKPSRAATEAGVIIDAGTINSYWEEESARRKAATQTAKEAARELRKQARAA